MAWGTVSIVFGGMLTVLSAPIGAALMWAGSVLGGAGLHRHHIMEPRR